MLCRKCGLEIAEKALICYRCGTATSEAKFKPALLARRSPFLSPALAAVLAILVLGVLGLYWLVAG